MGWRMDLITHSIPNTPSRRTQIAGLIQESSCADSKDYSGHLYLARRCLSKWVLVLGKGERKAEDLRAVS